MRRQNRHRCRDRATARVKRGNEPRGPRLLPCACPSSPRTGHAWALVAPHAAAVRADQGQCSRWVVARCPDEVRGRSVYHLTMSLGEERERGFQYQQRSGRLQLNIAKEIRTVTRWRIVLCGIVRCWRIGLSLAWREDIIDGYAMQ
jgi:hypothetical protein